MRTRQKQRVATNTWRSLGCRTKPQEHWSKRKPTVEPRCTFTDEKSIVGNHCYHITTMFALGIQKAQEKLPTLYWLPKLHK